MQRQIASYGRQVRSWAWVIALLFALPMCIKKLADPASSITISDQAFWQWFAIWLLPASLMLTMFFALITWGARKIDALMGGQQSK